MKLDLVRLKADMKKLEARIIGLKREIRGTPQPWSRNMWTDLFALKADATLLYAIRAESRGRLHMRKIWKRHGPLPFGQRAVFTAEDQTRWVAERWTAYAAEEV